MPVLAGWLTGEQVPHEVIEQTLTALGEVLAHHGGERAYSIQPGAGLIAFAEPAHALRQNTDPPVLDWVPDRRTLVYRRPLSGLHPLYYIADWPAEGNLLFASEVKALFAVGVPRRLHIAALAALARYGFIPAPWTIFKDIHVVPAGSILRWQRAKLVLNHATDHHLDEPLTPSEATTQHLHDLLAQASSDLLPPHEQLVALSNGHGPSALATLLAAPHTTTSFPLVTLGYTKSETDQVWDAAEQLAEVCERPLLTIMGVDQPEFWLATIAGLEAPCLASRPLALHQLLHTTVAETGARVALTGLGAHSLLGLTPHSTDPTPSENATNDPLTRYAQTLTGAQQNRITQLWSPEVRAQLAQTEPWEQTLHARKLSRRAAQFSDQQQGQYYLDLHLRLPDLLVNTMQQLAIQEQMAIRSPYLNTHVMDFLTRLPDHFDQGITKQAVLNTLLTRYLPQQQQPAPNTSLAAPTASLLHNPDTDLLKQTLSPAALKATGIFDPQAFEHLKNQTDATASPEFLLVFTTQLLCHLFQIDGWS